MAATALRRSLKITDCAGCHSICFVPKVLPCGHILCLKCLLGTSVRSAKCPTCKDWIFPAGSSHALTPRQRLDHLPTDHLMEMSVYEDLKSAVPKNCAVCSNVSATHVCLDCKEFYCTQDATSHRKMSVAIDHTVLDLSCLLVQAPASPHPPVCGNHIDAKAYSYCRCHNVYYCSSCATEHQQCLGDRRIRLPMQDRRESDLQLQVADMEHQRSALKTRRVHLKQAAAKVRQRREDAKKVVVDTFDELFAALRRRRESLLLEVEKSASDSIQQLEEGMQKLEKSEDLLTAYSANLRLMKTDSGLMVTYDGLLRRLECVKKDCTRQSLETLKGEWPVAKFDQSIVQQLKRDISIVGAVTTTSKETRPDTAIGAVRGEITATEATGSTPAQVKSPQKHCTACFTATDSTDTCPSVITAVLITDGRRLVMADNFNKSVKVTQVSGLETLTSVALDVHPWSMALLSDGKVAVTSSSHNLIHFMDASSLTVDSKVTTSKRYRGVACCSEKNELIVSSIQENDDRACVDIISYGNGEATVLRQILDSSTIDHLYAPLHLCMSPRGELLISEHDVHKILRLDLTTGLLGVSQVSHRDHLHPCQVTADFYCNVYVAFMGLGCERGFVLRNNPDGSWQRIDLDRPGSDDSDEGKGRVRARPEAVAITSDCLVVVWSRQGVDSIVTKFQF